MEEKICTETVGVLRAIEKSYSEALPLKVIEYLLLTCDIDNIPEYDSNKEINEQNISEDTKAFLTLLKLRYWCKTQEQKEELLKKIQENEKQYINIINSKLNINLFDNKPAETILNQNNIEKNTELVKLSEKQSKFKNMLNKFLNFIKRYFK